MNHKSHLLIMIGLSVAVLLLAQTTYRGLVFLLPLLCMGMMVWMLFSMSRHDKK